MDIDWAGIVAIITACVSLYIAWKKSKTEMRGTLAEADESEAAGALASAQAVNMYAQEIVRLREQIKQIEEANACKFAMQEERLRQVKVEMEAQRQSLDGQKAINAKLIDWAGRLAAQVESMGGTPVISKSELSKLIGENESV